MMSLTPIVRNLLLINVIIFFIDEIFFPRMGLFATLFGVRYPGSSNFQVYQVLTYMFVHGSLMHLFSNMIALIAFGPLIEHTLGSRRFLAYYMICGMGAGLLNYAVMFGEVQMQRAAIESYKSAPSEERFMEYLRLFEPRTYRLNVDKINDYLEKNYTPKDSLQFMESNLQEKINYANMVGASGAVFGIMVAMFLLFPNVRMQLLFPPVILKVKYLVGFYLLFELYAGVEYSQVSNVAHFAHLGGALIGFILIRYWGIRRQY